MAPASLPRPLLSPPPHHHHQPRDLRPRQTSVLPAACWVHTVRAARPSLGPKRQGEPLAIVAQDGGACSKLLTATDLICWRHEVRDEGDKPLKTFGPHHHGARCPNSPNVFRDPCLQTHGRDRDERKTRVPVFNDSSSITLIQYFKTILILVLLPENLNLFSSTKLGTCYTQKSHIFAVEGF